VHQRDHLGTLAQRRDRTKISESSGGRVAYRQVDIEAYERMRVRHNKPNSSPAAWEDFCVRIGVGQPAVSENLPEQQRERSMHPKNLIQACSLENTISPGVDLPGRCASELFEHLRR